MKTRYRLIKDTDELGQTWFYIKRKPPYWLSQWEHVLLTSSESEARGKFLALTKPKAPEIISETEI